MIFPTSETIQIDGVVMRGCSVDRTKTRWILPASAPVACGDLVVTEDGKRMEVVGVRVAGGFDDAKVEVECRTHD